MSIRSAKDYIEAKNDLINEFPWLKDQRFILNIMPGHIHIARHIFATMDRFFHPETFNSISLLSIHGKYFGIWVYFPQLLSKQDNNLTSALSLKYEAISGRTCSVCGRHAEAPGKKSPVFLPLCSTHSEMFSLCKTPLDVVRKIEKTNRIKSAHNDYFGSKPRTLVLSMEKYHSELNKLIRKHPWSSNIAGIDDIMPGSFHHLANFLRSADKLVNHNLLNGLHLFDVSTYSQDYKTGTVNFTSPNDTNAPMIIKTSANTSEDDNLAGHIVRGDFNYYPLDNMLGLIGDNNDELLNVNYNNPCGEEADAKCEKDISQQKDMIDYEKLKPGFKEFSIFHELWIGFLSNINSTCKICGDNSGGDYCKDHQQFSDYLNPTAFFRHIGKMSAKDVSLIRSKHKESFVLAPPENTLYKTERLFDIDLLDASLDDLNGDEAHYARNLSVALAKARNNQFQRVGQLRDYKSILDEFIAIFPNFSELHTLLKGSFSLSMMGDERVAFPPILLVGGPGIGKTEASRWLAEKLNVGFHKIDMTSISNTASIVGTERHWNTGNCGIIFKLLAHESCINPIVLLDEMDKAKETLNGDPYAPFHTLLEQSSAREFSDAFVRDLPINAGMINWIASANDIHNIPGTILSRFTEINVPSPTSDQKRQVIRSIYNKLLRDNYWGKKVAQSLSDEVIEQLMLCPSPRILQRVMLRAIGEAVSAGGKEITIASISKVIAWSEKRSIGFH